jgi:hypothetical protein
LTKRQASRLIYFCRASCKTPVFVRAPPLRRPRERVRLCSGAQPANSVGVAKLRFATGSAVLPSIPISGSQRRPRGAPPPPPEGAPRPRPRKGRIPRPAPGVKEKIPRRGKT